MYGLGSPSSLLARSSASSSLTGESSGVVPVLCTAHPALSTFRYCCGSRGEKAEQKNLRYALLSEVIREGGLVMAVMVRYSAVPSHRMSPAFAMPLAARLTYIQLVTTAIFATAGLGMWTFLIAAFAALPKQLATVYLGVAQTSGAPTDENGSTYHHCRPPASLSAHLLTSSSMLPPDTSSTKTTKIIKIVVITLTVVITIVAMRFLNRKIDAVKHRVIYARRKARQATLLGSGAADASSTWSSIPQDDAEAQDARHR